MKEISIKNDERAERMNRKREDGFTLIELMIVIAVIGILAIVLVPQVGSTKDAAKATGLDTNTRTVQAYVESRISSWDQNVVDDADVIADIYNNFNDLSNEDSLANPFYPANITVNNTTTYANDALVVAGAKPDDAALLAGSIVAVVPDNYATAGISIYQYGSNGKVIADKTVKIKP